MINFAENFWGEKNNGYDVLYQNMKLGHVACQDLIEYLKESARVEENYNKSLGKLVVKANSANQHGSFAPIWQIVKAFPEKMASVHSEMVHQIQDQVKELSKYSEELHTKHKSVKETESTTEECVRNMKSTLIAVHRAKDNYKQRILELERLKRENGSHKDVEKSEVRFKKAKEEYKMFVEKYAIVREDFNRKMVESSLRFQELEETHLTRLREFIERYATMWEGGHQKIGEVTAEFLSSISSMSSERLMSTFVETRRTGSERPGPIDFETADEILNGVAIPGGGGGGGGSVPGTPDADSIGSGFGGDEFVSGAREGSSGGSGSVRGVSGGGGGSTSGVAGSLADLDDNRQSGSAHNVSAGGNNAAADSAPQPQAKTSAFPKISLPGPGKYFWASKGKRKVKKKTRKKADDDNSDNDAEQEGKPQVDAEGFSIRPDFEAANKEDESSSFSEDDDDDPSLKKGFSVVIRPLEESSGSGGGSRGDGGGGGANNAEAMADLVKSARGLRSPSQVGVMSRNTSVVSNESHSQSEAGWPTSSGETAASGSVSGWPMNADNSWDDLKAKRSQSQSSWSDSVRPRSTSFTTTPQSFNPSSASSSSNLSSAAAVSGDVGAAAAPPSRRAASVTPQQSFQKQSSSATPDDSPEKRSSLSKVTWEIGGQPLVTSEDSRKTDRQ